MEEKSANANPPTRTAQEVACYYTRASVVNKLN